MIGHDEFAVARERGRLMAARKMATDPETRKRLEETVGVEVCRMQWPEAYAAGSDPLFEAVRDATMFPEWSEFS